MKLYIPQLKDKIRLTAPLVITHEECKNAYGNTPNQGAGWRITRGDAPWNWQDASQEKDFTLEEGTVLEFRRYYVSVQAKTNDIEVGIFASPRADLTPRKNGGTGTLVKLVLPTHVLNRIEYEVLDI